MTVETAGYPDSTRARLLETQDAFDSVAADYDGARGNNDLIQDMRREMWRWLDATFAPASRLIDLGCGTGLDAIRMAGRRNTSSGPDRPSELTSRSGIRTGRTCTG